MSSNEINIKYIYECKAEKNFKCKPNEKMKSIFKSIARREKIDIKFIYFMSEGKKLSSDIYDKTIREIIKQKN